MSDLDRLLGASGGFLLGDWVRDARAVAVAAGAPRDADFLEWNARSQVTSWYPNTYWHDDACNATVKQLDGLWDYGNKAWSGLVRGFYDRRYIAYAEHKLAALSEPAGAPMDTAAYLAACMQLACEFGRDTTPLPTEPTGDAVAIARELWSKYAPGA